VINQTLYQAENYNH